MDEGDHPFGAASRGVIHKLDPFALQPSEGAGQVVDDVTDVVEGGLGMLGHELCDPRLTVGRLDELDALVLIAEKDDADVLIHKVVDLLGGKAKRVAVKRERLLDARYRDRDVVQRAELHRRGGT